MCLALKVVRGLIKAIDRPLFRLRDVYDNDKAHDSDDEGEGFLS